MRETSKVFPNVKYFTEDVRNILNPQQNMAYLKRCLNEDKLDELVDIGTDGEKVYFVWKKSAYMNDLYDKWCKHEL